MKAKNSLKTLLFFICLVSFVSCEKNEDENEPKVTGYQEYILTVASQKLQGFVGIGVNVLTDVYAVKKDKSQEWKQFADIQDFDYKNGYEYVIKISETNYLDYRRGTPAWSEYKLIEIISKEKKTLKGFLKTSYQIGGALIESLELFQGFFV